MRDKLSKAARKDGFRKSDRRSEVLARLTVRATIGIAQLNVGSSCVDLRRGIFRCGLVSNQQLVGIRRANIFCDGFRNDERKRNVESNVCPAIPPAAGVVCGGSPLSAFVLFRVKARWALLLSRGRRRVLRQPPRYAECSTTTIKRHTAESLTPKISQDAAVTPRASTRVYKTGHSPRRWTRHTPPSGTKTIN